GVRRGRRLVGDRGRPRQREVTVTSASATRARAPCRVAALGLAAAVADVAFDPVHRHVPLCPFHPVTGWWCPLCGGLRAADSLVHGHIGAALHYNGLFVAPLPPVLFWGVGWIRT